MSERQVRRNEALRSGWYAAAEDVLATQGYGGLKLAELCRRLGVTTGSFYHSFDNWQDFTDSLLANWVAERTEQTTEIARQTKDPVDRLKLLAQASHDLLHRTEGAIRVWAGVDPRIGEVQRRVDDARYQVVHEAMQAIVGPDRAEAFTVWGLSTLIGYEMLATEHTRDHLLWSLESILSEAQRTAGSAAE